MIKEINGLKVDIDNIRHGKKCNVVSFEESLFNEGQFNALSKQYDKVGFVECSFKYKNDKVDIYYDTTGLISINEYFMRNSVIKETEFVDILKAICQSIKSSSNYIYFSDKNFVLDGDLIYINTEDKSVHIMYIPTKVNVTNNIISDFKELVRDWINNKIRVGETNFPQSILEELRKVNLDLDEFIKFLNYRYKEEIVANTPSQPEIKPIEIVSYPKIKSEVPNISYEPEIKKEIRDMNTKDVKKKKKGFFSFLFGSGHYKEENSYTSNSYDFKDEYDDYETEILGINQSLVSGFLTGTDIQGNKEKIQIDKEEFLIGRMRECVDFYIPNKAVGKTHAKFMIKDEKFYLVDLESKNGTYIDNIKLKPNAMYEVRKGSKITFANSVYMFGISE